MYALLCTFASQNSVLAQCYQFDHPKIWEDRFPTGFIGIRRSNVGLHQFMTVQAGEVPKLALVNVFVQWNAVESLKKVLTLTLDILMTVPPVFKTSNSSRQTLKECGFD